MKYTFLFIGALLVVLVLFFVSRYGKFFGSGNVEVGSVAVTAHEKYILPGGYHAYDIFSQTDNSGKDIGTYITHDSREDFNVEFVTKTSNAYFANGTEEIDFEAIRQYFLSQHKTPIMIAAAAFTPDHKIIQGFALEDGAIVGEATVNAGLNGLMTIQNSRPQLTAVSEISNWDGFVADLQKKKASLFQQTSYIRPGGVFSSTKSQKFELRFFVEGQLSGTPTRGIVDFSIPLTYTKAVELLQAMEGLEIERAIGLDTGYMSEAQVYDEKGSAHVLFDDAVASVGSLHDYRSMFTNVIVIYQ